MTWLIKVRGDIGAPILADYRCPAHGVFEEIVERPAPDYLACPECNDVSPWTPSSPLIKSPTFISTHRGKSDEKPHPMALDTEPLADGKVTMAEFRKQREAAWRAHDADADEYRPRKVYSK